MSKVKTLELPYDEEIRLAVTGWSGTRQELPSDFREKKKQNPKKSIGRWNFP